MVREAFWSARAAEFDSQLFQSPTSKRFCWRFRNQKTGGSHRSGAVQVYPTLNPKQIAALPVAAIAAKDALLASLRLSQLSPDGGEGRAIFLAAGWPCPDRHPACRNVTARTTAFWPVSRGSALGGATPAVGPGRPARLLRNPLDPLLDIFRYFEDRPDRCDEKRRLALLA
jgi:hypothetical protein